MIISYNYALLVKAFGWKLEAFIPKNGNHNPDIFLHHENFYFYLVAV